MNELEDRWWFCLKHMTVESDDSCPGKDRLGPYKSADDAAHALETVKKRNEEWDAADGQ
jgi:hypothetical protein